MLSTVDLLIKVAGFVKNVNNSFKIERSVSRQVSTMRSTVLSLPPQLAFPGVSVTNPLFSRPIS
jgi:hypothetical protein